jgi:hypothetical protein
MRELNCQIVDHAQLDATQLDDADAHLICSLNEIHPPLKSSLLQNLPVLDPLLHFVRDGSGPLASITWKRAPILAFEAFLVADSRRENFFLPIA